MNFPVILLNSGQIYGTYEVTAQEGSCNLLISLSMWLEGVPEQLRCNVAVVLGNAFIQSGDFTQQVAYHGVGPTR